MAPGGAAGRGRAGKFNKPTRGGGKHYSRGLQPVDAEGNQISMWSTEAKSRSDEEEEDSSEEESSEEEEDSDAGAGSSKAAAEANREDRKALKKARKDAAIAKQKARTVEVGDLPSSDEDSDDDDDDDMPANPNHSKAARTMAQSGGANNGVDEITDGVKNLKAPASRREREAMEAAAAKERYMKLHAAGKTDEAKADLARLKLIREQRAAEQARRLAEKEEKEEQEKARRAEIEAKEAKKREAAAGPKKASKKK